jgi:hypothetical protein
MTFASAFGTQISTHSPDCLATGLLQGICKLNTAMPSSQPLIAVGYVMKASREHQLAMAGLLHAIPIEGVYFVPLDLSQPLEQQPAVQVVLHKASDELEYDAGGAVAWSQRLKDLQQYLNQKPEVCVVDPFDNTAKVQLGCKHCDNSMGSGMCWDLSADGGLCLPDTGRCQTNLKPSELHIVHSRCI